MFNLEQFKRSTRLGLTPGSLQVLVENRPETLVTLKLRLPEGDKRPTLSAMQALELAEALEKNEFKDGHIREMWVSE